MKSVRLPVLNERESFAKALNVIKSAGKSGVVVVDSEWRARLIDADTLRDLAVQRPAGDLKEVNYPAIDLHAAHGVSGGHPTVAIEGDMAEVGGLEPRLAKRLELAVTWYVCSASPAHTYSPQEYRRLRTKDGKVICDVDDTIVR